MAEIGLILALDKCTLTQTQATRAGRPSIASRASFERRQALHGVVPAVIEAGGASGFVAGHLLRHFQFAAVLQVGGDARGAEAMGVSDNGRETAFLESIETMALRARRPTANDNTSVTGTNPTPVSEGTAG
jgi:hypothetical protein